MPIALKSVATGRWLAERDIGVVLDEPLLDQLTGMFRQLDATSYSKMTAAMAARPRSDFAVTPARCRELVEELTRS